MVTPHLAEDVERASNGSRTIVKAFRRPTPHSAVRDPAALDVVKQGLLLATHGPVQ